MKKICGLLLVCYGTLYADVDSAMTSYMSNLSVVGNNATSVSTQSANIMSAGGFATRSQSVTLQPLSFTAPNFSSSCGNIDFYGGAFSYLSNPDQLMKFLQNALITAAPLIFITALKSISPNLAGSIQSFFDAAQKFLNLASNSCQLGTYLGTMSGDALGGQLSKTQLMSSANSEGQGSAIINNTTYGDSASSLSNNAKDYIKALDEWGTKFNNVLNPSLDSNDKKSGVMQQIAYTNGSIIWKGLQQLNAVSSSAIPTGGSNGNVQDLANLVISLTGDVILVTDKGALLERPYIIPPSIKKISSLYSMSVQDGDSLVVYNCQKFNPVKPSDFCFFNDSADPLVPTPIPLKWTFKDKVNSMIQNIQNNLMTAAPLTDEDKTLIAMTKIPVFQMAQALYDAGMGGNVKNILEKYQEQIAFDLAQNLLSEAMTLAQSAAMSKVTDGNSTASIAVGELGKRISELNMTLAMDANKLKGPDAIQTLNDINRLRSYAQSSYSPTLIQKVQFAKMFNNH